MRLHQYQEVAVQHLHRHPRAGVMLDLGMGKTATVLSALTPEHLPALVIAPKRVAEEVWTPERDTWRPDLSIAVAAGSPSKRADILRSRYDITVIGRDNIKDVPVGRYRTIVLDELSGFKNRGSQRWKHAKEIRNVSRYTWGLTGTPASNGYMDLWAQIYLLDQGERLGRTLTEFRNRYFTPGRKLPNGVIIEWNLRPGARERIDHLLSDICVSMSADDYLTLPPVTHNRITVPLPGKTMRVYEDMRKTLVARVDLLGVRAAKNAAVMSGKLQQITAGFLYPDTEAPDDPTIFLHDEKIKAIQEIVDGTGSPILMFYRFQEERSRLLAQFPQARTIESPNVLADWNAGRVPILLAHPASAGHGLNLQHGGHTMVWASLPWSLEEYEQSLGRLARQGQKSPVVVHYLLSPGTIDEQVLSALEGKKSVQDALLDALAYRPENG